MGEDAVVVRERLIDRREPSPGSCTATVMSTAKTRARRPAQPIRRGIEAASRNSSGRPGARHSESCIGASGCGEDGMTRARR